MESKARKPTSFRLSELTLERLEYLKEKWEMRSTGQVIEQLAKREVQAGSSKDSLSLR
jgi:predicted DNA-binding protein